MDKKLKRVQIILIITIIVIIFAYLTSEININLENKIKLEELYGKNPTVINKNITGNDTEMDIEQLKSLGYLN